MHALEPAAGIGRFLRAFEPVPGITWHAVEWSELSARMLHVLRPDVDLMLAPFERWVREKAAAASGRLGLVVSNPPHGIRGASIAEDPDRAYRERMAYHYFLRRGLDLLAPDGLGVFLVPGGFLTSRTAQFVALREKVLKRHHLAAAFRLPSINEKRREAIFPGAMLVTDVLDANDIPALLDAIEGGDISAPTWRTLLDRLRDDEAFDDDRAWALIRQHVRAIADVEVACGLACIVVERSMDAATATYALTTFLRRTDAPRDYVEAALWSLIWLTACERSDTGAIEDAIGSVADAQRFTDLVRAFDVALGASSFGTQLREEARDRLRPIGAESLLAHAARHLAGWQHHDVAAAPRRAAIE